MKGSVDNQLRLGEENPISLSLLVEGMLSFCVLCSKKKKNMLSNADALIGFKYTLFQIKLLSDGIYIPIAFGRFSLVEEIH